MKKRILSIALLAVLTLGAASTLIACGGEKSDRQSYVSLDINPAIELIVDKNDKVISVRGENEDGQVLLYEETGIQGEKIDKAIEKITDLAIKYGYLDENNKVVDTLVTSSDDKYADKLQSKISATITATADNLGLTVTTDTEGAYSLLRKMDEVKKQFPNNDAIQNMSVQKFKLALSVSETEGKSIEATIQLDDKELIEKLKSATSEIEAFATDAYNQAKEQALAIYDEAVEAATYEVYTAFCLKNISKHPTICYCGGVYQAYATAAKGINAVIKAAELAASVANYPLTEEQINTVVTALGLENSDPLKNSEGKVTVQSIEAYADKVFKNTPAGEQLEQTKKDLTDALEQAESVIKQKVNELSETYKSQIEEALEAAETVVTTLKSTPMVGTLIGTALDDMQDIIGDIKTIITGDAPAIDVLKEKANRLEEKANEYLKKIEEDLSAEELEEIESDKAKILETLAAKKQVMENAISKAEAEAKQRLESLKQERMDNASKQTA